MTHNYIEPLKLLVEHGFDVILYDQLGCGESSFVQDPMTEAPFLITLEYYVKEVFHIVKQYNLSQYYLFGSSWGTIVCQEVAVLQPKGLQGLMLDGALADAKLYIRTQWRDRLSTMTSFTEKTVKKLTGLKQYDSPMYKNLEEKLTGHFTIRQIPIPDFFKKSFETMNPIIYKAMQGDSEFTIG